MVTAVILMGGMGILIGALLAVASKVFYVYVDPKIEAVEIALPGANCGGCGLPGCGANAEAIVAGKSGPDSCVAGGPDLAETLAVLMGVKIEAKEPDIARPGCYFGVQESDVNFEYDGLKDCRAVALMGGGMKVCRIGCLGLGTCAQACPFDAITMGPEGLPVVDEVKCTGCGTCERVCPKHIINLSSVTRRILREYTTVECTTPCQRACPAGINIREYIRQAALGDYHRSVQVIKERNPFPTVIGRICPRPCEDECRRNYVDEPVAINFIKRYVADYEREIGKRILPYKTPETDRKIAIIGGGVEGLSTAFFSARLGHSLTVFEATPKMGGLLRSAIARERLPLDILDWDIEGILEMGVQAETGKALGKDFTVDSLLEQGFETVFLATGGWDSRLTRDKGKGIETPVSGCYLLVDLLKAPDKIECHEDVVITGGGKLVLDAVRILGERGAKKITVLFRENWEESPITDEDLKSLGDEELTIQFGTAVTRLFGEGDKLSEIEYVELESKTAHTLPLGTLIIPAGRFPELIFKSELKETDSESDSEEEAQKTGRWEAREPYKQPVYSDQIGLLAKGDAQTDYSAAIRAIGAGRRAAVSIHQMMYELGPGLPEDIIIQDSVLQNVNHVERVSETSRNIMPLCGPKELAECKEIEKGFSKDVAKDEASRCLQCGLICYERKWSEMDQPEEAQQTA